MFKTMRITAILQNSILILIPPDSYLDRQLPRLVHTTLLQVPIEVEYHGFLSPIPEGPPHHLVPVCNPLTLTHYINRRLSKSRKISKKHQLNTYQLDL